MKKMIKPLSFVLAALLLCLLFASCGEKEPEKTTDDFEVISDRCVPLFNEAVEQYMTADCKSSARAAATVVKDGKTTSYIQSFDSLLHNRADEKKIISKYYLTDADPEKVDTALFQPFYTCYVQKGICYFDFEDETANYRSPFVGDYLSRIGLYPFSDRMPRSVYAVKDGDVIRISMTFSPEDGAEMERMFVATMTAALAGSPLQPEVSPVSLTAFLDAETHRFQNYTVSFTASLPNEPDTQLIFGYTESFSDYGTTEGVVFPDLSTFPEKDLSGVTG